MGQRVRLSSERLRERVVDALVNSLPRIRVLTSGGTIATRQKAKRSAPELTGADLVDLVRRSGPLPDVELEPEDLTLRPSWSLDPEDMHGIARAAVRAAEDRRLAGVIVTHGTTTLEYSAYLTDLHHATTTPIVFTGAMRRADAPDPDGPSNLRDAITVAADPTAAGLGTLVVFAGRILSAREAWKQHRNAVDAFLGLEGGVGTVHGGVVRIARRPRRPPVFSGPIEPRVALVKAYPGAGREVVDAAIAAGARGLVVEGLPGLGGVPEGMRDGVRAATEQGCVIVLASRAPLGEVPQDASGGTGEPLASLPLIAAGDLTAEKAWVLLMVALGGGQGAQVRRIFEDATRKSDGKEKHG